MGALTSLHPTTAKLYSSFRALTLIYLAEAGSVSVRLSRVIENDEARRIVTPDLETFPSQISYTVISVMH